MKSSDQLYDFLMSTLACIQSGRDYLEQRYHNIPSWLVEMKYVTMDTGDVSTYCITPLGYATLKGTVVYRVPGKHPWALKHNSHTWVLTRDINCIHLYGSCHIDTLKFGTWWEWVLVWDIMVD